MRLESLFPANWRWCRRGNQELLCLRWRFKIRVVVKGGLSLQNNTQYLNDQNYLMNQLHKSVLENDFNAGLVCHTSFFCYQGHRKWNSLVKEVIHTTNPSHTIFYQKCLCDYCNLISTGLYLWIDLPPSQGGNWRSKNVFRVYCRVFTNHRLIQSMNHILPSGWTKRSDPQRWMSWWHCCKRSLNSNQCLPNTNWSLLPKELWGHTSAMSSGKIICGDQYFISNCS